MNVQQVNQLEIALLLDGIFRRYGYDFHGYAANSLSRRVTGFLKQRQCRSPSELLPAILHNPEVFWEFVSYVSVPFTEFFRDPECFRALREKVFPYLQTFPFPKVWIAGCATGEEGYSAAILLHEEGLLDRTQIYCTDVDPTVITDAKQGRYTMQSIQTASRNYKRAGGRRKLSDYFSLNGEKGVICSDLKKAITFSKHNLIGDGVFGEMNLVLCRNVLIYFSSKLQNQVLTLLTQSLHKQGILCLSPHETLQCSSVARRFEQNSPQHRIYRLRS